jgi:hypothetical protein
MSRDQRRPGVILNFHIPDISSLTLCSLGRKSKDFDPSPLSVAPLLDAGHVSVRSGNRAPVDGLARGGLGWQTVSARRKLSNTLSLLLTSPPEINCLEIALLVSYTR